MSEEDDIILSELPDEELVPQMQDDLYDGLDEEVVEGVNIARRIARHAPLTSKISEEYRPNASLDMEDYDATLDWARNNTASIYHPTGTCKMGDGKDAVVDARLRVHGIDGLRVADCSIMPEIVSGNTNAPAIMIGEKAAAMIMEDVP